MEHELKKKITATQNNSLNQNEISEDHPGPQEKNASRQQNTSIYYVQSGYWLHQ